MIPCGYLLQGEKPADAADGWTQVIENWRWSEFELFFEPSPHPHSECPIAALSSCASLDHCSGDDAAVDLHLPVDLLL